MGRVSESPVRVSGSRNTTELPSQLDRNCARGLTVSLSVTACGDDPGAAAAAAGGPTNITVT